MIEYLNSFADKWFAWEVTMLWQVSVLIGIIWLVDLMIRKWVWPQVRYAMWMLVLVKLMMPVGFSSPVSVTAFIPELAEKTVVVRDSGFGTRGSEIGHGAKSQGSEILNQVQNDNIGVKLASAGPVDDGSDFAAGGNAQAEYGHEAKSQGPEILPPPQQVQNDKLESRVVLSAKAWSMVVWVCGMGILTLWLVVRLSRLRREHLKEQYKGLLPERFDEILAGAAAKLKLKRLPAVVVTDKVCCPAVFGVFRPVLLMPAEKLQGMSEADMEHVLLHELAHIKRGDLVVHAVYMCLQIAYWFNPLLWMIRRTMQNLRELCCDATVARVLKDKTYSYRETLLSTARELLAEPVDPGLGLLGLFENSNWLVERLKWLEKKTWKNRPLRIATTVVLVGVMFGCVLPMAKAKRANTVTSRKVVMLYSVWKAHIVSSDEMKVLDLASGEIATLSGFETQGEFFSHINSMSEGDIFVSYKENMNKPMITFFKGAGLGGEPATDGYRSVSPIPVGMPWVAEVRTKQGCKYEFSLLSFDDKECVFEYKAINRTAKRAMDKAAKAAAPNSLEWIKLDQKADSADFHFRVNRPGDKRLLIFNYHAKSIKKNDGHEKGSGVGGPSRSKYNDGPVDVKGRVYRDGDVWRFEWAIHDPARKKKPTEKAVGHFGPVPEGVSKLVFFDNLKELSLSPNRLFEIQVHSGDVIIKRYGFIGQMSLNKTLGKEPAPKEFVKTLWEKNIAAENTEVSLGKVDLPVRFVGSDVDGGVERYHWRLNLNRPVRLARHSFKIEGDSIVGYWGSVGGTPTKPVDGANVDYQLVMSQEGNTLDCLMRKSHSHEGLDGYDGAASSSRKMIDLPECDKVRTYILKEPVGLDEKYLPLWKRDFIKDGKVVKALLYAVRVVGENEDDSYVPTIKDIKDNTEDMSQLKVPGTFNSTAEGRDALGLEFHILPESGKGDWQGLSEEEIERYINALKKDGPFAETVGGDSYKWAMVDDGFQVYNLISAEYKGNHYVLYCASQKYSMLAGGKWELRKVSSGKDNMGNPCINFVLDDNGSDLFYEFTNDNKNRRLAIFIDGIIYSAPRIRAAIKGKGIISGSFSDKEVKGLVENLKNRMGETEKGPEDLKAQLKVPDTFNSDSVEVKSEAKRIKHVTFTKGMSLRDGLRFLGKAFEKNIIPSDKVDGQVPVADLFDIDFEEALRAIIGTHKYVIDGDGFVRVYAAEELTDSQKREVYLPDVDGTKVMLDLASGELVELPEADGGPGILLEAIDKGGKGDIIFDSRSLIFLRGAKCNDSIGHPGGVSVTSHKIPADEQLPEKIVVATRDGVAYELDILSVDEGGVNLSFAVSTKKVEIEAEPKFSVRDKVAKLSGELMFHGKYRHKSRGKDISTPSELWIKRNEQGELSVIADMPWMGTYDLAVGDQMDQLIAYRVERGAAGGRSGYYIDLKLSDGKAVLNRQGVRENKKDVELEVGKGMRYSPNTRPDSYAAANLFLRSLRIRQGEKKEFEVYDWSNSGEELVDYKIEVSHAGKESVTVPAGTFEANHYILKQLTSADTWFKKRAGHVTEFWTIENGVIVRVLRHREPYEMVLIEYELLE